ncbi:MAG: CCA tRNA nucleotidyltransferase [Lachnospiraceae bacterium]|nr:CCA tRNA nucleotidyltransferase [Lachnospiraceae bacterium]
MRIELPEDVKNIIGTLTEAGFEAYAVGGCVRDALIGRTPMDWDITSSAKPEDVKKLFKRTVDTGIQHGTVTVMIDKTGYEVTTYRIDGEYDDCRHPKEVTFTTKLSEDLLRRDFTINAMAYNETEGLVDLFGGREDLERGVIRCVGEASERFDEDALRILRAFRFAAQLGFEIEGETLKAAAERAENLKKVSAERIRVELNKILLSKGPDRLFEAQEAGVTKVVLPEFDAILRGGADARGPEGVKNGRAMSGMKAVKAISLVGSAATDPDNAFDEKDLLKLKWAALLSEYADTDIFKADAAEFTEIRGEDDPADRYEAVSTSGMADAEESKKHETIRAVLTRLKFDNETRDTVTRLVDFHRQKLVLINDVAVRGFMKKVGPALCPLLFELQTAELLADGFVNVSGDNAVFVAKNLPKIKKAKESYRQIVERGDCVSVAQLAVTGSDLIEAGFEKGPEIGRMLDFLLGKVLADQSLNVKEKLIDLACMNY